MLLKLWTNFVIKKRESFITPLGLHYLDATNTNAKATILNQNL
jgi:hypothetical protein